MYYNKVAKKYTEASYNTSKIRQIIMLYEGMIKFLNIAKDAIKDNDHEKKYNMIEKTSKILVALKASLDFSTSGNIADILDEYYNMTQNILLSIHISNDIKSCDELIEIISMMKSTWIDVESEENYSNNAMQTNIAYNLQLST